MSIKQLGSIDKDNLAAADRPEEYISRQIKGKESHFRRQYHRPNDSAPVNHGRLNLVVDFVKFSFFDFIISDMPR